MKPKDFEIVVDMYQALCKEVYPNLQFKERDTFAQNVALWVKLKYDILIIEDKEPVAFMMCFYDNMGGITDLFYKFECAYVVPKYRNSRATLLMKNTLLAYVDREGIILQCNASMLTLSSKIVSKFGMPLFTTYERMPNGKSTGN